MPQSVIFKIAVFVTLVVLVAALYWLTLDEPEDPCANPQGDISGAVLADEHGDQDALVNRAIIMKSRCEREALERAEQAERDSQQKE